VTFLTTRTSTGSKVDVFHQSQPLTQSSDVTHAVRVVKNVTCLSSLLARVTGVPDISIQFHVSTRPLSYIILVNLFNSEFANMASTTNNIDADEYSEDQQHVEPGQGSSNSKKAKTWRIFPIRGQVKNKIVKLFIFCWSVTLSVILLIKRHSYWFVII
jgi:hypothetical protein